MKLFKPIHIVYILLSVIVGIWIYSIVNMEVEGQTLYNTDDDKPQVETACKYPVATTIKQDAIEPDSCVFKNQSCKKLMDTFNSMSNRKWNYGKRGIKSRSQCTTPECISKRNCMLCVQGSEEDSNTSIYLAGIGKETNDALDRESNFAYNKCDALAATCSGSGIWYANKESDWEHHDCHGVSVVSNHTKSTRLMCGILTNSILQFFLGLMGGVMCTLEIEAIELKQTVEAAIDDAIEAISKPIHNLVH